MAPKQQHLQQEAVRKVQSFMDDADFQEAVRADVESLGPEVTSAIRQKILDLLGLSAFSVRDLINKWKGEISQLDVRKSQTRLQLLDFLSELMRDPKFQVVEGSDTQRRAGIIQGDLGTEARRIKGRAKQLLKGNQRAKALELLMDHFRRNRPVQNNIGFIGLIMDIHFRNRQYPEAYEFAKKILALEHQDIPALWIATASAQKLENWSEALSHAEEFIAIFPQHEAALGIAATAAHNMGQWNLAFLYASKKMNLKPKIILPTLGILANAAYEQRMFSYALKYSTQYLEIRPKDKDKLTIAAFSAFHLGKYDIAIRFAREYFHAGYTYNSDITKVIAESVYKLGLT